MITMKNILSEEKHVSLACKAQEPTIEMRSWLPSLIVMASFPMKGVELGTWVASNGDWLVSPTTLSKI